LKHRLSDLVNKEKLRGAEFRQRSLEEERVHFCEPEQGLFLGEEDEYIDERLTASLKDCVESLDQHKDMLKEKSNDSSKPYVFKSDNLSMIAGCARE